MAAELGLASLRRLPLGSVHTRASTYISLHSYSIINNSRCYSGSTTCFSVKPVAQVTKGPSVVATKPVSRPERPATTGSATATPGTSSVLSNISQAFSAGATTSPSKPSWMQARPPTGGRPGAPPVVRSTQGWPTAAKPANNTNPSSTASTAQQQQKAGNVAAAGRLPSAAPASPAPAAASNSMNSAVDAFKRMREEFAKLRALKEKRGGEPVDAASRAAAATKNRTAVGVSAAAARSATASASKGGMFGRKNVTTRQSKLALHKRTRLVHSAKTVAITDDLQVKELAKRMGVKAGRVLSKLEDLGELRVVADSIVEPEVAEVLVGEFGHIPKRMDTRRRDRVPTEAPSSEVMAEKGYPGRPPVVSVMGHVDHGKTTLMDALRGTSVAEREAGGITQSVAAFTVNVASEAKTQHAITFLDTPGHALFASMRQRGISVADIVVLVIDGKDGVMPQTKECIKSILDGDLAFVVAITKCDVVDPDDAVQKIGKQLLEEGVATNEFGGEVQMIPISAKSGLGLQELKEAITFQAELLDLRANAKAEGEALIIDSKVLKGTGIVVDAVVTWGTVKVGDIVVAGLEYGKVKALLSDTVGIKGSGGKKQQDTKEAATLKDVSTAPPGTPVRVMGMKGLPSAGEHLLVVDSEERAKAVIEGRLRKAKVAELAQVAAVDAVKRAAERDAYNQRRQRRVAYETALQRERKRSGLQKAGIPVPPHLAMEPWEVAIIREGREGKIAGVDASGRKLRQQGGQQQAVTMTHDHASAVAAAGSEGASRPPVQVLPLITKADSSGSLVAMQDAVLRISKVASEVLPKIVNSSVGELSEKDVQLAADMGAQIVCFNAKVSQSVQKSAEKKNIEIRSGRVIYHLLDEICDLIASRMTPTVKNETVAVAEVKAIFALNSKKAEASKVAGCVILEGTFSKSGMSRYRVMRDEKEVAESHALASLMHLKDKVDSVKKGMECGMMLEGFAEIMPGDRILAIKDVKIKPKLEVRFD